MYQAALLWNLNVKNRHNITFDGIIAIITCLIDKYFRLSLSCLCVNKIRDRPNLSIIFCCYLASCGVCIVYRRRVFVLSKTSSTLYEKWEEICFDKMKLIWEMELMAVNCFGFVFFLLMILTTLKPGFSFFRSDKKVKRAAISANKIGSRQFSN